MQRSLPSFLTLLLLGSTLNGQAAFSHFESPQTHPVRLSADGSRLFSVHTAAHRLSVFDVSDPYLPLLVQEIDVGIEPVSVHPHTPDEVWVVNHVSDTVSVVSLAANRVVATIRVPDEPSDVVFAGTPQRAFVSASRSNAIHVIDVTTRAILQTIPLLGEHPRALVVDATGSRVYVAFALSGNRTTCVPAASAPPQGAPTNPALPSAPQVGRIIDATNPAFSAVIRYDVLDHDVAEIDATSLAVVRYFDRAGTVNLGLARNPVTGDLFLANTDARNLVRFEPNLRGHVVDNRITRITTGATPLVTPFDLNPTVSYTTFPDPASLGVALAQPTDIVVAPSGAHLYVAAFGTDRVAKVDTNGNVLARIEIGPAVGSIVDARSKRGPRGLALHASGALFVQNRLSHTLSVIDTATDTVIVEVPVGSVDPTPAAVREGRGFLYDAKLSGNGTVSCASCHVDGEEDHLGWDLGDPSGSLATVQDPSSGQVFSVHPMKGPMTTQTMKGLAGTAPFHWRGDRADLSSFNPAFDKLMGGAQISASDMGLFSAFVDSILLHPNPNLELDRSFAPSVGGADPAVGFAQFQQIPGPTGNPTQSCSSCHSFPSPFTPRIRIQGPGQQPMDVPFMRSHYKKNHFSRAINAQNLLGFGLEHDGTAASAILPGGNFGPITAYFASFDTGTAPAVGFQRTLDSATVTDPLLAAELSTLEARALVGDCDVIGKGAVQGVPGGFSYEPATGIYRSDRSAGATYTRPALSALAALGQAAITISGVLPGQGERLGRDRDLDGTLDGDEASPGYFAHGIGCAGSGGIVPLLSARGVPIAGAAFSLELTGALGGSVAVIGFGSSNGVLPLTPSCALAINPILPSTLLVPLRGMGIGQGSWTLTGILPTPLLSTSLHIQAVVLDPGAPDGFSVTNALRAAIE